MTKHVLLLAIVGVLAASSTGCQVLCWPYGPGQPCSLFGNACGQSDGCGECGQVDECGGGQCGPIGLFGPEKCCAACQPEPGPLSWIFDAFSARTWYGRTCGAAYYGDFYSDPPAIHDPCDCQGNYTGGGCSSCGGGGGGGCASCSGGGNVFDDPFGDNAEAKVVAPKRTAVARQTTSRQQPTVARQPQQRAASSATTSGDRIVASRKISETTRIVPAGETVR
jgi:hypothetical protein